MRKYLFHINVIVIFFALAIWIVNSTQINQYITELKTDAIRVSNLNKDALYNQIKEAAPTYDVQPQNAKIDRVWKAMPGYNGLTVDIGASYEKMKDEQTFSENKLVFKQVPPPVTLKDLEPAPVYKGHPDKPMVSFLINVAWGNEYIPTMLATLKEHHVKVTFFLEGRWVKENPELAKMIVDAGHEVGNHSYTHADFKRITTTQMKEEITKTNEVIEATTGKTCNWFAPPSGSYRDDAVDVASTHELRTVMWTIDTIDWQKPSPSVLINRVVSKLHPGALILMHPTEPTAAALNDLIVQIKAKQLKIDTVSHLLSEERVMSK